MKELQSILDKLNCIKKELLKKKPFDEDENTLLDGYITFITDVIKTEFIPSESAMKLLRNVIKIYTDEGILKA